MKTTVLLLLVVAATACKTPQAATDDAALRRRLETNHRASQSDFDRAERDEEAEAGAQP